MTWFNGTDIANANRMARFNAQGGAVSKRDYNALRNDYQNMVNRYNDLVDEYNDLSNAYTFAKNSAIQGRQMVLTLMMARLFSRKFEGLELINRDFSRVWPHLTAEEVYHKMALAYENVYHETANHWGWRRHSDQFTLTEMTEMNDKKFARFEKAHKDYLGERINPRSPNEKTYEWLERKLIEALDKEGLVFIAAPPVEYASTQGFLGWD